MVQFCSCHCRFVPLSWSRVSSDIPRLVEVGITILCSCAPSLFSLAKHLLRDLSFIDIIRSRFRTRNTDKAHGRFSKHYPPSTSDGQQPVKRPDNVYLELGDVANPVRDRSLDALGRTQKFDFGGNTLMLQGQSGQRILKMTDVEVKFPETRIISRRRGSS